MTDTPYWNPRHETMPRERLEALQVRKLRNLVDTGRYERPLAGEAAARRRRDARSVQTLDDLRRIPFMTRDEWMQGQLEEPPFGTCSRRRPRRPSGTT